MPTQCLHSVYIVSTQCPQCLHSVYSVYRVPLLVWGKSKNAAISCTIAPIVVLSGVAATARPIVAIVSAGRGTRSDPALYSTPPALSYTVVPAGAETQDDNARRVGGSDGAEGSTSPAVLIAMSPALFTVVMPPNTPLPPLLLRMPTPPLLHVKPLPPFVHMMPLPGLMLLPDTPRGAGSRGAGSRKAGSRGVSVSGTCTTCPRRLRNACQEGRTREVYEVI